MEILASAPAHLWSQREQPTRYAHEPGELENVARAVYGDAWADHEDEFRANHAVFGAFTSESGGTIINVGVTDWAYGLRGDDPILERVTRNVLTKLSR